MQRQGLASAHGLSRASALLNVINKCSLAAYGLGQSCLFCLLVPYWSLAFAARVSLSRQASTPSPRAFAKKTRKNDPPYS